MRAGAPGRAAGASTCAPAMRPHAGAGDAGACKPDPAAGDAGARPDAGLVRALSAGQVALVATDTVYGLAAVPSMRALEEICALKGRPRTQPVAWLAPDAEAALELWAQDLPQAARNLAARLWPGALTLVLQASPAARATHACAADGTVALRVPDDEALRAVMRKVGSPLACTSANPHGAPAPARRGDIDCAFLALPHAASLPARCPGAVPSAIVDCTGEGLRIVRAGALPKEAIMDAAAGGTDACGGC